MSDFLNPDQYLSERHTARSAYLLDPTSDVAPVLREIVAESTHRYLDGVIGQTLVGMSDDDPEELATQRAQLDALQILVETNPGIRDTLEEQERAYSENRTAVIENRVGAIATEAARNLDADDGVQAVEIDDKTDSLTILLSGNGQAIVELYLNGLRELHQPVEDEEAADTTTLEEPTEPTGNDPEKQEAVDNPFAFTVLSANIEIDDQDPRNITVNGEAVEPIATQRGSAAIRAALLRALGELLNESDEEIRITTSDIVERSGLELNNPGYHVNTLRSWADANVLQHNGKPVIGFHSARKGSYYYRNDTFRPSDQQPKDDKEKASPEEIKQQTEFHVIVDHEGLPVSISNIDLGILTDDERRFLHILHTKTGSDLELYIHAQTIASMAERVRTGMNTDHAVREQEYAPILQSLRDKLEQIGLGSHITTSGRDGQQRGYRADVTSVIEQENELADLDPGIRVALGALSVIHSLESKIPRGDGGRGVKRRGLNRIIAVQLSEAGVTVSNEEADTMVDSMIANGTIYDVNARGSAYIATRLPVDNGNGGKGNGGKNKEKGNEEPQPLEFDPEDDLRAIMSKYTGGNNMRGYTDRELTEVDRKESPERRAIVDALKERGHLRISTPGRKRRGKGSVIRLSNELQRSIVGRQTKHETIDKLLAELYPPTESD